MPTAFTLLEALEHVHSLRGPPDIELTSGPVRTRRRGPGTRQTISQASRMAAIMLSGRARFFPAISKAVPWSGLVRG